MTIKRLTWLKFEDEFGRNDPNHIRAKSVQNLYYHVGLTLTNKYATMYDHKFIAVNLDSAEQAKEAAECHHQAIMMEFIEKESFESDKVLEEFNKMLRLDYIVE